jgi:hypothetical protein
MTISSPTIDLIALKDAVESVAAGMAALSLK